MNNIFFGKQLIYRLLIALTMFTICRVFFLAFNYSYFSTYTLLTILKSFIIGLRFDLASVIYVNLVFILLSVLPFNFKVKKSYQSFLFLVFVVFNSLALVLEITDFEYYQFAQRRSSISEFNMAGDIARVLPVIIKDYWYTCLLLPLLVYLIMKAYRYRYYKSSCPGTKWYYDIAMIIVVLGFTVVGARGGFQLRPITPAAAGELLKEVKLIPLATNTTLNFIFSFQQKALEQKHYFPDEQLDSLFTLKRSGFTKNTFNSKNVVLIIMESLGKEYMGKFNTEKSNTPFLDSLMDQGVYYESSYANAQRSAQGIVAISAGIPALMEEAYHFSPYQSNQLESIATCLKKKKYTTAFFHGSNPGSMDFERFASISGFDHFYDKRAFGNESLYDGNWGIWDIPFFEWMVDKLSTYKPPFFGMVFSLTSHHPFNVEPWFEKQYPNEEALPRAVRYSDLALRKFFERASKTSWFKNTVFVITADHTGISSKAEYQTKEGMFRVPILFYSLDKDILKRPWLEKIPVTDEMQQVDIMPSILDVLHYDKEYYSFGTSIFTPNTDRYCFQYSNGVYQLIYKAHILLFDGNQLQGFYNLKKDPLLKQDISQEEPVLRELMANKLKAVIQRYNRAMVRNELAK